MKTTTDKKIKVKFNCGTAIYKNPEFVEVKEAMTKEEMAKRMFTPLLASKVVNCGQIVELTAEEYKQFEGRQVWISTGMGGHLADLKALANENGLTSSKPYARRVKVPMCEIVA